MEVKIFWQVVLRLFAWTYELCQSLQLNRSAVAWFGLRSVARREPGRLWPLDAVRGAAVIVMVETHVFNTAADPGLQNTPFTGVWSGLHGLVAPLFFVVTGYALELKPPTTRPALRRRLRGIALWWGLGMLLHLPSRGSAGSFLDVSPLLQFDVLHALAMAALGLTATQLTVRRRSLPYFLLTLLTLAGAVVADRSSWVGSLDPWCQGLVVHTVHSRFPLLPWSAFAWLGAWLAAFEGRSLSRSRTVASGGWVSVALLFSVLAFLLGCTPWGRQLTTDGRANPLFTLERAGVAMALVLASLSLQDRSPGRVASALTCFGRRSLGLYCVHLFLFFTEFAPGGSWASQVAARCSVDGVAGTTVLLLGFSLAICWCAEVGRGAVRAQNPLGEWTT
jgi:uncharacterized membrane protein